MSRRAPWWVILIALLLALPAGSAPWLIAQADGATAEARTLLWLFPAYLIVSAVLACVCFNDRPWLSWILFALMLMSSAGVFALVLI